MSRGYNFNAGPAVLPEAVLEQIRDEIFEWRGSGASVMEISHRSADFKALAADSEARLRRLMGIPGIVSARRRPITVLGVTPEPHGHGSPGRLCGYRDLVGQGHQ